MTLTICRECGQQMFATRATSSTLGGIVETFECVPCDRTVRFLLVGAA